MRRKTNEESKKTTKAVSAILAVVMLIGVMMCASFSVSAAETYGDFEYSLNDDNTCTITKYNGSASDLTIPSEIQGNKIVGIGDSTFAYCTSLTKCYYTRQCYMDWRRCLFRLQKVNKHNNP
ncbi:MAG: hypothetical protein MR981_00265 [Ruminococcus bromii]|nr:hypothetical protein [Ruminococcus bromii]